jgi:hypothetical protein
VTLERYRRLREPKVNGGRNASPGARGRRPQLRARRFLVPTSRERNARYIAAVRRSRSCVSHGVFRSTIMQLAGQEVAMWGLWSVFVHEPACRDGRQLVADARAAVASQ